jgi:hypothetical protein
VSQNYSFQDQKADISPIIPLINLQGESLVGAEVGVFRGDSFFTLLHNCPNVSTLYGVDAFKPYSDFVGSSDPSVPAMVKDEKEIDFVRIVFHHRMKFTGCEDRVKFLEMDSSDAAKEVADDSLDFVFLDSYLSHAQACNDLEEWFPKVKSGGIFAGHDWTEPQIASAVNEFRARHGITSRMSTYADTWVWFKDPVGD